MPKFKELSGERFGKLLVLARAESIKKHTTWLCVCDCGTRKVIRGSNLRTGKTSSCGCMVGERAKERLLKHGRTDRTQKRKYREYTRELHVKRKYGITIEFYNDMLETQDNCCAICGYEFGAVQGDTYVDHCHATGVVRGLLCRKCNTGIGMFNDNTASLANAIDYLQQYANAA